MTSLILGLLLMQQLQVAPAPKPPQDTVANALVILEGVVNETGRLTNVQVTQGAAPFIQPSLEAVKEWEFAPAARPEHMSVTFLYRARKILPDMPYEFNVQTKCCALPTHVVDPGYPVNSIGEGSVIVQVRINARGSVERVRVVRPEPSLTEAAVNAVQKWKFATDRPSSPIVVISFRRPVLSSR
jgi:TonB family protein